MLRPAVWKKSIAALSSNDGELETSTTTCAPAIASGRPSPVIVSTPAFGAAAVASWPRCFNFWTTFDPIRPVPPITTIFMTFPPAGNGSRRAASHAARRACSLDRDRLGCLERRGLAVVPHSLAAGERQEGGVDQVRMRTRA